MVIWKKGQADGARGAMRCHRTALGIVENGENGENGSHCNVADSAGFRTGKKRWKTVKSFDDGETVTALTGNVAKLAGFSDSQMTVKTVNNGENGGFAP